MIDAVLTAYYRWRVKRRVPGAVAVIRASKAWRVYCRRTTYDAPQQSWAWKMAWEDLKEK